MNLETMRTRLPLTSLLLVPFLFGACSEDSSDDGAEGSGGSSDKTNGSSGGERDSGDDDSKNEETGGTSSEGSGGSGVEDDEDIVDRDPDDYDGDGVVDGMDTCWRDPEKLERGFCGCGEPEDDSDGDGVPDCKDSCPLDAYDNYNGDCGCASDEEPVAEGSECNDSLILGDFTCDNAGVCGNPLDQRPEEGCTLHTIRLVAYWVCSPPDGRTFNEAAELCDAVDGRTLLNVSGSDVREQMLELVDEASWMAGTDRENEGDWFWLDAELNEDTQFWEAGSEGKATDSRYVSWGEGEPADSTEKNCMTFGSDGFWQAEDCGAARGYVCRSLFGSSITPGG